MKKIIWRLWAGIRFLFRSHEAWALRAARRLPILAFIPIWTLWIWLLILIWPLNSLMIHFLENGTKFGVDAVAILLLFLLIAKAFWFIHWSFICIQLMFGGSSIADWKERRIQKQLKQLAQLRT